MSRARNGKQKDLQQVTIRHQGKCVLQIDGGSQGMCKAL